MNELSIVLKFVSLGGMKKDSYFFMADSFTFTPAVSDAASGRLFDCSKDITIETPSPSTQQEFSITRSGILFLKDSTDQLFRIGSDEIPASISIIPNLNSSTLKISCKMLTSPYLSV